MTNYASTNEPENYKPMTLLDAEGMEASVSDYMQSDEFKRKVEGKQEDKVSNELGTREHYEEYVRNCEDAGIMPVSWVSWEIQYPQPVASAPASVEVVRLEDLAQYERNFLERLPQDGTAERRALWPNRLLEAGLINVDLREDANYITVTDKYTALVRDYQRRQAASVDDTFHAKLIAGASSVTPVYTPERIAALEAENARLQSELDAAREANARLRLLLNSIVANYPTLADKTKHEITDVLKQVSK